MTRYTWKMPILRDGRPMITCRMLDLPDVQMTACEDGESGFTWSIAPFENYYQDNVIFAVDVNSELEGYPTLEAAQIACENYYRRFILYPDETQ